uniref:Ycf36 n=1 Tax=Bostrychia tenella TaxID=324755 RepID=A0A1Z1M5C8_9FLOR|nr:hypothetical protein [Bostrychia tenella]ARW61267.1 hypothetical protein [Bostrychia tenella]
MCIGLQSNCPVPFDQQPVNEYLALKRYWLFSWSTYNTNKYVTTVFFVFLFLFFVVGFFIFYIYSNNVNICKLCILNFLVCDIILFFIFMRLYLGWSYIMKRLMSATIFYEESGWYDGQIWIKTSEYLIQDRLIGLYQIMPLIQRIKYTFIIIICAFLSEYFFYSIIE